ncbi:hypothetical protein GQ54DRAFT_267474, partial [Martensiomyces pterosporus]
MHWLDSVDRLVDLLFFAIHISYGQPARIPEVSTIKVRNPLYDTRNVFFTHGTISLVTTYWKGRHIQNYKRSIARFLPKPLMLVLVKYVVLVCP